MHVGGVLGGMKRSSSGQAPLVAGILFLLLVPTTIIIAENATSNITGNTFANLSLNETNTTENNETPDSENTTEPSSKPITISENISIPLNDTNQTYPVNETNVTYPNENITANVTSQANETIQKPTNVTNVTTEQNQTQEPEQQEEPYKEPLGPVIDVKLNVPERADRNEPFQISAEITNTGDMEARDVEVEWILPKSLSIIEGGDSQHCDVPAQAACQSELKVVASLSSELGEQEVKVLVSYFD
jgi:hypothetical protein